jgi:DNA-binding NarL/FixJ family response regulator
MIRVAVVARSALMRAGLESLIRGDPEFEITERPEADVLLVAGGDEWAVTAEGDSLVVLIGDLAEPEFTIGALHAGVRALLPPDASKEEIGAAIRAVATGLAVMRSQDLEALLPAAAPDEPGGHALSPREVEILRMLAEGMANKTIAWKLGISEHTVKFHVASILNRLNAASRTEAVTIGIRRGLIMI